MTTPVTPQTPPMPNATPQDYQAVPALSTIEQEAQPKLGQSPEEVRTPSFGLSMKAATYSAIHEGTTANVLEYLETSVIQPDYTDTDRPYLKQDEVNKLWKDSGIPDAAPDATKYNDVGIYTLIDKARHRQAARDVDAATEYGVVGTTARGLSGFALSMADPLNAVTGFFPAAGVARLAGLAGTAAKIEGIAALGATAETLGGRVAARAASGAIEGTVGNIPLEAVTAPMRNQMGEDYTAVDSMKNLLLGSAIGGGLHVAMGSIGRTNGSTLKNREPELKATMGDEVATKTKDLMTENFTVANKISEASVTTNALADIVKSDLLQATDHITTPKEGIAPEIATLSEYMQDKTTTSNMLSETLNKYNDLLKTQEPGTEINKPQLMREAIDSTKPTAADLAEMVTPETRENVAKIAMAQSLDNRFPTIENTLKADPNIGTTNLADIKSEMSQAGDYKNSFVTMEAKKVPPAKELKYEHEITPEESIATAKAKIEEMEKLQEAGVMYSKSVEGNANGKEFLTLKELRELSPRERLAQKESLTKEYNDLVNKRRESDFKLGATDLERLNKLDDYFDQISSINNSAYNVKLGNTSKAEYAITNSDLTKFTMQTGKELQKALTEKFPDFDIEAKGRASTSNVASKSNYIDLTIRDKSGAEIETNIGLIKVSDHFNKGYADYNYDINGFDKLTKANIKEIVDNILNKLKIDEVKYSKDITNAIGDNPGTQTKILVNQLYKEFGQDADKLLSTSKLKIVEDVKDLPGVHDAKVKGMTVLSDGSVYLVAKNLSPSQVRGVVLHEVGVHSNMQAMLGEKAYKNILSQVERMMSEDNRIKDLLDGVIPKDTPEAHMAEERLAYLVENASHSGIVKEFLAKIKAWLYKTFPGLQEHLKLTQADLASLALASLRSHARKDVAVRANAEGVKYSVSDEIADQTKADLEVISKISSKLDGWTNDLKAVADDLIDIEDVNIFQNEVEKITGRLSENEAKDIHKAFGKAFARYQETGALNPAADAIGFVMNKIKSDLIVSQKALTYDRGVKARNAKFLDSMTDLPEDGVKGLLIGTSNQRKGTQAYNAAMATWTTEDRYLADFDHKIIDAGLMPALKSKAFDDQIVIAMEAIQNKDHATLKGLPEEAQKIAQVIEDSYNSMLTELNDTGLTVNKIKGYFFNQMYVHNQERIFNAGRDEWIADAKRLFDTKRMSEELNMKPSEFNDAFWDESYRRFSTGEHNDAGSSDIMGGYSGFNSLEPFRSVNVKERKYHFNNAKAAVEYMKKYGNKSLTGCVAGTIRANARKLGLVRTLGVNYERNTFELLDELEKKVVIPEQLDKFKTIRHDAKNMIRVLDGRADVPVSGMLARFGANARAALSMTMLSKAGIAGLIGDPMNAAIQDVKLGMTKLPLPFQYLKRISEQMKIYSPEKKSVIRSMGVATDNLLMDAYRYDSLENNVSGFLARAQERFFQWNFIEKQGQSSKMAAMDMIGSSHAGFVKVPYNELSGGLKRYLERYNIDETDWKMLSQTKLLQADGKEYLAPETLRDLTPQALELMHTKGLTGNVAETAARKYLGDLENRFSMYYRDLLSRQYLEPNQVSKYYNTWKGQGQKGTPAGEAIAFAMQFKQYGINFWRNVILDEVYSRHDTAGDFGKSLFADWSSEGMKQKGGILWKLGNFAIAGIFTSSLYDILGGRKPRVMSLEKDASAKNMFDIFFTGLYRSGGLGFMSDYLFADYSRFGNSLGGALAGPLAGRIGEFAGLVQGGATGTYKMLTGEKSSDTKARWLKFVKGMLPGTFYSSIIMNYVFWYGIQEKMNPGYLRRMERQTKKLSNQEFIAPPSKYALGH
jgi:hypothetical protein